MGKSITDIFVTIVGSNRIYFVAETPRGRKWMRRMFDAECQMVERSESNSYIQSARASFLVVEDNS